MDSRDTALDRFRDFLGSTEDSTYEAGEPPGDPADRPLRLGKYRLLREVARGGSAVIFEAEDTELGRRVALKIIREGEGSAMGIRRLHREAAIAAQLHHPNIVGIHEIGMLKDSSERPTHFIVMDFVDGGTLADALRNPKIGRPELLRILEDAARAVAHAHDKGVIHRDLKPSNILVEPAGRVLLTDFGLARAEWSSATQLTRDCSVMGTPQYMAPEQVEGKTREIDFRTDVYALGATLYEVLTGRPPFLTATVAELFHRVVHEEPQRPSRIGRSVEPDLEVICLKALEKRREDRYGSVIAFAEDLRRFRNGEPILARSPSLMYWMRKSLRKRWTLIATAAVALVLMAASWAIVGELFRARKVRNELDRAARCEREGRFEDARDAFRRVLDLDGENPKARYGLDRVESKLKERERNIQSLLETGRLALEGVSQYLYNPNTSGEELTRRAEEARVAIDAAVDCAPGLPLGRYLQGWAWEIQGWEDRAEACWRECVRLDANFGPAHYRLGRLFLVRAFLNSRGGIGEDRVAMREQAKEWAKNAAKEFEAAMLPGTGFDDELQRGIAGAMLAYVHGGWETLKQEAQAGIGRFQGHHGVEEFYWLMGLAEGPTVCFSFDRAIELCPKHALALFSRGNVRYLEEEGLDGAIADYTEALKIRPRFVEAYYNRAIARATRGDHQGALEDVADLLRIDPRYVDGYINRGRLRRIMGDLDGAMADYDEALKIDPRDAGTYVNRGAAHYFKGDFARAIQDYDEAIELDPGHAGAYTNRGIVREKQGDLAGALADHDEAIRIDPTVIESYVNRGRARLLQGDLDGAIGDSTAAIGKDPRCAEAYLNRGGARKMKNDFGGAIEDFDKYLGLCPDDAKSYVHRGDARYRKGDVRGAIEDFEKALTLRLEEPLRLEVERNLGILRGKR